MVMEFFHFAKLAHEGKLRFKDGRIIVNKMRVLLMDTDTLAGLRANLSVLVGEEAENRLAYEMTKLTGSATAKAHYRDSKKKGDELVYYLAKMSSGAGWGKIKVTNPAMDGEIFVEDSPFLRKGADKPTCDYLRGLFAGTMSYVYRTKIDCIETECASLGAPRCKFVMGKAKHLLRNQKNKKFAGQIKTKKDWQKSSLEKG